MIQMSGQRQLHQNAIDLFPAIQFGNEGKQFLPAGIFRQGVLLGVNTKLLTGLVLIPHIHLGSGVLSHQYHSQAGGDVLRFQCLYLDFQFGAALGPHRFSINDLRAHGVPLSVPVGSVPFRSSFRPACHPGRLYAPGFPWYPHSGPG